MLRAQAATVGAGDERALGFELDGHDRVVELDAPRERRGHPFGDPLYAVPRGEAEARRGRERTLALGEGAAEQQQQRRDVVRIAAEAHIQAVGERDRAFAQAQAAQPIVRRDVEGRVARVEPVAGLLERVVAHREDAVIVPRHLLPVTLREVVRRVRRPLLLTDQLAVEREILLAEELEYRRHVHELDPDALGGVDDAGVACADVGAAGLGRPAELAHRMHASADALLRLEHEHPEADGFERQRGVQAGQAGADDDDIAVSAGQRTQPCRSVGSSTPHRAGFNGPGRPGKQQSGAQRSWLGPSAPSARRGAPGVSRSTISSRTIAM